MEDKRFIEETFPVKEVSEESASEKSVRHGHISTLHIWWARRPLASSRATNFAALIPAPRNEAESQRGKDFIAKLSRWENSLDRTILEKAKQEILSAVGGKPPRILDPFAGGGAIPLEALRLGCDTYAGDYNPVSTLLLKCTVEFPQKFGGKDVVLKSGLISKKNESRLIDSVRKWGDWVLAEATKEISKFYPTEKDGSRMVGALWARTIPCQNPSCNAEIPLLRQFWLSNSGGRKVVLFPLVSRRTVHFRIIDDRGDKIPRNFDPDKGTISGAIATCLVCGSVVDGDAIRKLSSEGKLGQKMLVLVSHKEGTKGKSYRIPKENDREIFEKAISYLADKEKELHSEWGLSPVPDEPIHTPDNKEYRPGNLLYNFTPVMLYGMTKWGDLFNSRQKLALIVFADKVRKAHHEMLESGFDVEYAKAVTAYLALGVDRLADYMSQCCMWVATGEFVAHTFGRQALPMVWDYFEISPFSQSSGDWNSAMGWIVRVVDHLSSMDRNPAHVYQGTATRLPFSDSYFDAVMTDPPYYDNVPYADLSDFFYVWLKRVIGDLYPDLFSTPLTPKGGEAIAELPLLRGMGKSKASMYLKGVKTKEHFENTLLESFREIRRVLKPGGISVVVYAHKSTEGWETLINSLLDSGLVVTGAWPLHTERPGRLRSFESAALASSIYMVTRKLQRRETGFYSEVRGELKEYLKTKLDGLWKDGISGPDFFIAAIGSAIEVFGKYEKVIDDEGNVVRGDKLLEEVRRIVTDYAVKQVLHNGFAAEIKPMTRLYILWRWAYGDAIMEFDDARKLGQSVGVDIAQEWNKGFISKEKEFIEVLGPEDRKSESLEGSTELIDVLHYALLLWKRGQYDEVTKLLRETGYGKSDVFYRVAQAISESLTNGNKEKKLLDGFLSGKERIVKEVKKQVGQSRLFE
jgi:putative DNA methylase